MDTTKTLRERVEEALGTALLSQPVAASEVRRLADVVMAEVHHESLRRLAAPAPTHAPTCALMRRPETRQVQGGVELIAPLAPLKMRCTCGAEPRMILAEILNYMTSRPEGQRFAGEWTEGLRSAIEVLRMPPHACSPVGHRFETADSTQCVCGDAMRVTSTAAPDDSGLIPGVDVDIDGQPWTAEGARKMRAQDAKRSSPA